MPIIAEEAVCIAINAVQCSLQSQDPVEPGVRLIEPFGAR